MNATPSYSIKDTRIQLSHLIDKVAIANRQFIITKFGKPKAMLIPVKADKRQLKRGRLPGFGAWATRKDMRNSAEWVEKIRDSWSKRNE